MQREKEKKKKRPNLKQEIISTTTPGSSFSTQLLSLYERQAAALESHFERAADYRVVETSVTTSCGYGSMIVSSEMQPQERERAVVNRVIILVKELFEDGGTGNMTLGKLLKQPILPVMVRFCDDFCAIFLNTLLMSAGSVIRNVVSRRLRGSRGPYGIKLGKALTFHQHSIIQSSWANKTLQHPCLQDLGYKYLWEAHILACMGGVSQPHSGMPASLSGQEISSLLPEGNLTQSTDEKGWGFSP